MYVMGWSGAGLGLRSNRHNLLVYWPVTIFIPPNTITRPEGNPVCTMVSCYYSQRDWKCHTRQGFISKGDMEDMETEFLRKGQMCHTGRLVSTWQPSEGHENPSKPLLEKENLTQPLKSPLMVLISGRKTSWRKSGYFDKGDKRHVVCLKSILGAK